MMMKESDRETGKFLKDVFLSAVEVAHPENCLRSYLPSPPTNGKTILLAGGKAAGAMMKIACQHYLECMEPERLSGVAVHHHATDWPLAHMEQISAGHPVPDENSQKGALRVLELAQGAGADDLVVVLLSGGASALWSAPVEGVTLADKQEMTRALLRCGADIVEINCVRKHLSRIKGGALARVAVPARLVTLAISDVVGDDPSSIGSGPTSADPSSLADAREILDKYGVEAPEAIKVALADPRLETLIRLFTRPAFSSWQMALYRWMRQRPFCSRKAFASSIWGMRWSERRARLHLNRPNWRLKHKKDWMQTRPLRSWRAGS